MGYYCFILFFLSHIIAFGQISRCSTDEYRATLKKRGLYNHAKKNNSSNNMLHGNYTIPIVVHVLYNNNEQNISDEKIASQIDVLNDDYNASNSELMTQDNVPQEFQDFIGNVGISFCLAQVDPDGNMSSGINRVSTDIDQFQGFTDDMKQSSEGGIDAWDTEKYLNIWVCNLAGNTLGFATMPGDVEESPELDGIVIDYEYFGVDLSSNSPYNLGRTGTHEIGHYFGLEHTFLAGCSSWDNCDDTPSIASPTYGCPSFPQVSCQSNNMTMNFMDYTNDACMYMFTDCQANVMLDVLLDYRDGLLVGNGSQCSVSIQEIEGLDIVLYPNPAHNILHISSEKKTSVSVFDIYGRQVLFLDVINDVALDVSTLPLGTYFALVDNNVFKFIKH